MLCVALSTGITWPKTVTGDMPVWFMNNNISIH